MQHFHVPQLSQKFQLIVQHSEYEKVEDIAPALSIGYEGLRNWIRGTASAPPDAIPMKRRESVIRFFCAHLPHLPEAAVIDLLEGPYEDMQAEFARDKRPSLSDFIEKHAKFDDVKVFSENEGRIGIVRARTEEA